MCCAEAEERRATERQSPETKGYILTAMTAFVYGVAAALALAIPAASSQPQTTLTAAVAALTDLRRASESLEPGVLRSRIQDDTDWLIAESERSRADNISDAYVRSFQQAAELVRTRPTDAVLADISGDLQAKREHCRNLKIGMGGVVKLRVQTRRGSSAVPDWQVLHLLKIYEWVPSASAVNFPRLSTPTEMDVAPGRYLVWARDPATGKTSDRVLVKAAGQGELLVDLAVP